MFENQYGHDHYEDFALVGNSHNDEDVWDDNDVSIIPASARKKGLSIALATTELGL